MLRCLCPELRVCVVNVTDLMILEAETLHPHSLTDEEFSSLFTADGPVFLNYHGYANEIDGLWFGRKGLDRVGIASYQEEIDDNPVQYSTEEWVSSFHMLEWAISKGAARTEKVMLDMTTLLGEVRSQMENVGEYVLATGKDPEGMFDIPSL